MKLKVNGYLFEADEPIMVILTDKDKENINNMSKDNYKYCAYPDTLSKEDLKKFMDINSIPPQDRTLFKDEYLSLKQLDTWYTYAHMSRTEPAKDGSGQGVAILVYTDDQDGKLILGRYETCIVHKSEQDGLTSITGGVDKGSTIIKSALNELHEEAGYEVDKKDLQDLGTVRISKQEDSLWHLFSYNATGKVRRQDSIGDGTKGEENAYCKWVSIAQAVGCKCPLVATMIVRAGL